MILAAEGWPRAVFGQGQPRVHGRPGLLARPDPVEVRSAGDEGPAPCRLEPCDDHDAPGSAFGGERRQGHETTVGGRDVIGGEMDPRHTAARLRLAPGRDVARRDRREEPPAIPQLRPKPAVVTSPSEGGDLRAGAIRSTASRRTRTPSWPSRSGIRPSCSRVSRPAPMIAPTPGPLPAGSVPGQGHRAQPDRRARPARAHPQGAGAP